MPRAVAQNVVVDTSMDRLVVFTHGRGVWAAALGTDPPDTAIAGGPTGTVGGATASFTLSANPAAGATFQCKLDDQPFETCSANPQYSGLEGGNHVFQARAISSGGSDQSPAFRNWTIDDVAPDTSISSAPPAQTSGPAAFSFTSTEPGSTFECKLDSGGFNSCPASTVFNVAVGPHQLAVRARDGVGNVDATPASAGWTETSPPPSTTPPPGTTTSTPQPSPTGTTPAPSGGQAGVIAGRLRTSGSLSLRGLTKGLKLGFTCARACVVDVTLGSGRRVFLRGRARLTASGAGNVKLKAGGKTAKALRKLIGRKLTLVATFSGSGASSEKRTVKLKLKR
jgi:hypothetical protein